MSSIPETDLSALATETAAELGKRIGVDGAFVVVYGKSRGQFGGGLFIDELSLDGMFATAIKALLELREAMIRTRDAAAASITE